MKKIMVFFLFLPLIIYGCTPKEVHEIMDVFEWIIEEADRDIKENNIEDEKVEENNYLIAIDPGHQRFSNYELEPIAPGLGIKKPKVSDGAIGISTMKEEYELTLEVSMKLKDKLEGKGYGVVLTRDSHDVDISNVERAMIANQNKADLFIRIHADQRTLATYSGISILCPSQMNTYTKAIYNESNELAELVLKAMLLNSEANDMGISYRDDISGFNWSQVPVILVELGFMSNPEEDKKLSTDQYQNKLVEGMFEGINAYFDSRK